MSLESLQQTLNSMRDPENGEMLSVSRQVKDVAFDDSSGKVSITIALPTSTYPLLPEIREQVKELARRELPEAKEIVVQFVAHERPASPLGQVGLTAKHVIAVGSGKGGVGKSTVSLSIALALKKAGCKVGLLDADVYGPSVPQLTGVRGQVSKADNKIGPLVYNGMPIMSIGFMVPPDQAVIWRGPMLHSAITTFLRDVAWGELDFLIIDMPPGTGDIALSLSQQLPISGAVVVCTPQEVALIDAIKAVAMFRQVKIPVAGVVENMSGFLCPDCNKRYDIFGKGGARQYAEEAQLPFLGEIPIHIGMRERGDAGKSIENFDDPQIAPYLDRIAFQLVKHLSAKATSSPIKKQLPVLG
ncbi:MAG: Mrp/NBP35 family ATP-binding protein [Pirellulaceae bacterium]